MTIAYGGTTVTIGANLIGVDGVEVKPFQNRLVTESGSVVTYDRAVTEWKIPIKIRVTETVRDTIRDFLRVTVQWSKLPITFTPDAGWDTGNGSTALTTYFWQDTYRERPYNVDLYEVEFILRAVSTGTGVPS
jgi:hypothetical protein